MPDIFVLTSPRAHKDINDAEMDEFFDLLRLCVAETLTTEESNLLPSQVTAMEIPWSRGSDNAPDIQVVVLASANSERLSKLVALAEELKSTTKDYMSNHEDMRIEVWPIMPPGKWLSVFA